MKNLFALIGNQNSGKTTLFNQLTGSKQHVGNFPGVTVEKKEGFIKKHGTATLVDLPGIYSLSPYSAEEIVTRDFLLKEKPNLIINILDATNIERNLYLSLQLIELNIPMVIALNMMDEVMSNGNSIDLALMEHILGIPVIPISASKNQGIDFLLETVFKIAGENKKPEKIDFCSGSVHKAIHAIAHIIADEAEQAQLPLRFAATKIVEGDELVLQELQLNPVTMDIIHHIVDDMEASLTMDREAAMADMRYNYIQTICEKTVHKKQETKEQLRSVKIDNILTHKYLAIPIFLGIMLTIFWLTFGVIGHGLTQLLALVIDGFTNVVSNLLLTVGVNATIHSFLIDGVFAGVGSVLSFLPTIITLFLFLSLLEDSGYIARVAFVMDKLLRKIGLSGRSFVPLLIGFGCSVPAIMATRTLSSERDKKMTILLTPFMSCSAKLPIYAVFTQAFFADHKALVMIGLYLLGMVVAIISGLLLKSTVFKGNPIPFIIELPAYRMPSAKTVVLHMWDKAKDFLTKAFTIIFLATIIIWFLQSFDFRLNMVANNGDSILASLGKLISPIFVPLGFGDWRIATSLLTGLTAKEAVVSTLTILMGVNSADLSMGLQQLFTPLQALSFLTFTLLYMPCVAALSTTKKELGSFQESLLFMGYQTLAAWLVAFLVYHTGLFLGF